MKKIILLCAIYLLGCAAYAQVTIGSGIEPEKGALLDLKQNTPATDNTTAVLGMALPRVNITNLTPTAATGANSLPASIGSPATESWDLNTHTGLTVYNLANDCRSFCPGVYTWSGTAWERMGEACPVCIEPCGDCDESANITTFVNVMYDFQHQELEAYGVPDSAWHQWQVSADNFASDITPLSGNGANTTKYTIPADFIHNYDAGDLTDDKLYFRCLMDNANGDRVKTPVFEMLFIRTTVGGQGTAFLPGYGMDNGVRYLTVQKGEGGNYKAGTIKIALLNLGQSNNGDAADLGDLYQWGRVADEHEHIEWTKPTPASYPTFTSGMDGTSDVVTRDAAFPDYTAGGQIPNNADGEGYYGNFIVNSSSGDWGANNTASNSRWGDSSLSHSTRASNIALSKWAYPSNNPCPSGWVVPSYWSFWDISDGNGTDAPAMSNYANDRNNDWKWRAVTANSTVMGGLLITSASDGTVYLPALGYRFGNDGTARTINTFVGYYWTSTSFDINHSYGLLFNNSGVNAGYSGHNKSYGRAVRCVAE